MKLEVHDKKPDGFTPQVEIAACHLEIDQQLLLLQRAYGKEPGKWGVPAGKLEAHETPEQAAKRELFEETGISPAPSQIEHQGSLYIRKPEIDYVYHLFKVQLDRIPDVRLSEEHVNYRWATAADLENLPLVDGGREILKRCALAGMRKRSGASVNAYLILQQDRKLLLQLRKNTGYCDGMWSLIAGHVEDGESATAALIREAHEEIGITFSPSEIKVVHVMHRQTNRLNVDLFFQCSSWTGTIQNGEPHKCERLAFFSLEALPPNIVEYNVDAVRAWLAGRFYSEQGWDPIA